MLDADAVRQWSRTAVRLLDEHRADIDALNVFPVADSDTGANTLATIRAAAAALSAADAPDAWAALRVLADGSASGALGNSGFIISQVLRGLADAEPGGSQHYDGAALAAGLQHGAALARSAVVAPVEGTVLTVAQAAADAACGRPAANEVGGNIGDVVLAALRAADAALQQTPAQLAVLAQAGVVDAGGLAYVVLLDALARTITGGSVPLTPVRVPPIAGAPTDPHGHPGFEVQYLLDAPAERIRALRASLANFGDSVAVVAVGPDVWKVHVHLDDIGAGIEAGVRAGRPHGISVVSLAEPPARPDAGSAVLAVAPGAGLAHLFESAGAHVVHGGPDDPPSVDAVVAAIAASKAYELVLLTTGARVSRLAETAAGRARGSGVRVTVVPTRSPVQGLSAVAVHDPARAFDDDVVAMAEAAAATRFAELRLVRETALTAVGICGPGDVLGMIDGEVVDIGRGLLAVAFGIVDRLLGVGAELITVLVGDQAPPRTGELIEAHVRSRAPFTDVSVHHGGQCEHPVIIGVE